MPGFHLDTNAAAGNPLGGRTREVTACLRLLSVNTPGTRRATEAQKWHKDGKFEISRD